MLPGTTSQGLEFAPMSKKTLQQQKLDIYHASAAEAGGCQIKCPSRSGLYCASRCARLRSPSLMPIALSKACVPGPPRSGTGSYYRPPCSIAGYDVRSSSHKWSVTLGLSPARRRLRSCNMQVRGRAGAILLSRADLFRTVTRNRIVSNFYCERSFDKRHSRVFHKHSAASATCLLAGGRMPRTPLVQASSRAAA